MKSVGLLTSILMVIPMLAVPFLAIFGIPQLIPAVASPTPSRVMPSDRFVERRVAHSDAFFDRVISVPSPNGVDLFRPTSSPQASANDNRLRQIVSGWHDPLALKAKSRRRHSTAIVDLPLPNQPIATSKFVRADTSRVQHTSALAPDNSDLSAVRYERQAKSDNQEVKPSGKRPPLTWKQASGFLDRMGIRKFHLTAGTLPGEYKFSCLVTSVDDRKISREFQAESADPLAAVEKVLVQVDNWINRR